MTPEQQARKRLNQLTACLRRAAKNPGEAGSIHRLRVAIRRFTQVLRVFDGCFSHTRKMRRRLRGLMDLCGAVRNCDIASEVLAAAGVARDAPDNFTLDKLLKQRRAHEGRKLAKLLAEWNWTSAMRNWRAWLKKAPGKEAVPPPAPPQFAKEFRESGDAAAKAGAKFKHMHKFRLQVKKLRYTLEILNPDSSRLPALRGLQERLGAISDCATTADLIHEIGLGAAEERSIAEKRSIEAALECLLAGRAAKFRAYWRTNFRRRAK
jgi:CHAD domain-containing protein